MRLWDYRLVTNGLLPKSQLLGLWRELNSIFKKQDNHILINYVYEYPKENLKLYARYVMVDMIRRGVKIKSLDNFNKYFGDLTLNTNYLIKQTNPFPQHHTDRYLKQCFYNLQEKYDRGQKDFDRETYEKLLTFICEEEN